MNRGVQIHKAFTSGDFEMLSNLAGEIPGFPNCHLSSGLGHCLEYAIYHSPLAFIKELLEMGAKPGYNDHAGFPCIIAALSSDRNDVTSIIDLLLDNGADINQRGVNDWTPLHYAAVNDDVSMVKYLLRKGADPTLKTRIDDCVTPLEEARILGSTKVIDILELA